MAAGARQDLAAVVAVVLALTPGQDEAVVGADAADHVVVGVEDEGVEGVGAVVVAVLHVHHQHRRVVAVAAAQPRHSTSQGHQPSRQLCLG